MEKTNIVAKNLKAMEEVYKILNFTMVFNEISEVVKCKTCDGEVKFCSTRGLEFKITVVCGNYKHTNIFSCPKIGNSYEINRRFVFAMRCLGQDATGAPKCCGLKDLPAPVAQKLYLQRTSKQYSRSVKVRG